MRSISNRRRSRRYVSGGYAMVDALTAVAISAVAATFALQLLARCAADIRTARAQLAATQLAERLYEEARVESSRSLLGARQGRDGGLTWTRDATLTREPRPGVANETVPVQLKLVISDRDKTRLTVEAILQPAPPPSAAAATEVAASRSPRS
jgi:Tfp pilus assembly protein PilV